MNEGEKEQLRMEIQHIFDSGANEIRVFEMIKSFIESRNGTNKLTIHDVVERVSRMKDDSGREGCTYGDTDYDSMTVVYGYNLAIDNVTDTVSIM